MTFVKCVDLLRKRRDSRHLLFDVHTRPECMRVAGPVPVVEKRRLRGA